jgi:hypothetical protein
MDNKNRPSNRLMATGNFLIVTFNSHLIRLIKEWLSCTFRTLYFDPKHIINLDMKQFLVIFMMLFLASCQKKKNPPSNIYPSQGNILVLVLSGDTLEYGVEYQRLNEPDSLPIYYNAQFDLSTSLYDVYIAAGGEGILEFKYDILGQTVDSLPVCRELASWNFTGGLHIQPNKFTHTGYDMSLVPTDLKFIIPIDGMDEGWQAGWDLISDLNIVSQYRFAGIGSKVGYLKLDDADGEEKKYFFFAKTAG